ncbi:MAG: hypothetical protein NXI27_13975 [Alphaproteobacteria bacterium]|nr:hypothetical protein [Alphaproteobacteria bacterium]
MAYEGNQAERSNVTFSRRNIIVAGAAYLCGFPALAHASNDSIETMLDEVRKHLLGRFNDKPDIDDTNRMPAGVLRNLVPGKSAYGTTCSGKAYVLAFQPEGRGLLQIEGEPLEVGRWWISDSAHTIHSQWPSAADGEALNLYYRQLDDDLFAARTLDDRRCSFFFIGETPPELESA